MNEKADAIAARIAAFEQRLLVAVLRGDDHARLLARGEIARLKKRLPRTRKHDSPVASGRSAATPRVATH